MTTKQINFDKCSGCPHYKLDPPTIDSIYWNRGCCVKDWDGKPANENDIRLLMDPETILDDCTLPDLVGAERECLTCHHLERCPSNQDPCYSCNFDYDKWEPKRKPDVVTPSLKIDIPNIRNGRIYPPGFMEKAMKDYISKK